MMASSVGANRLSYNYAQKRYEIKKNNVSSAANNDSNTISFKTSYDDYLSDSNPNDTSLDLNLGYFNHCRSENLNFNDSDSNNQGIGSASRLNMNKVAATNGIGGKKNIFDTDDTTKNLWDSSKNELGTGANNIMLGFNDIQGDEGEAKNGESKGYHRVDDATRNAFFNEVNQVVNYKGDGKDIKKVVLDEKQKNTLQTALDSLSDEEVTLLNMYAGNACIQNGKMYRQPTNEEVNNNQLSWIEVPKDSAEYLVRQEAIKRKANAATGAADVPTEETSAASTETTPTPTSTSTPSTTPTPTPTPTTSTTQSFTPPEDAAAARQGKALEVETNGTNAAQYDLLDNAVVYPSALTIVADRLSNDSDNEFLAKLKEGADDLKEALNCYDLDASDLSSDSLSVPEDTDAVSFHLTSAEATADNIEKIVKAIETQLPGKGEPLKDAMKEGDEISVAMIDKDLKFSEPFSQIKGGFDLDNQNYSAFGLTSNSEEAQREQVSFCSMGRDNYATKLKTENEGESIILIPLDNNNRDSSHQELLDSLNNKKWSNAEENDSFKAPCLDFQQIAKAENPFGENTAAVQITKIKLDETGVELEATAAGSTGRCIIRPKAPDYTNGDFAMVMVREVNGKQVLIGGVKCEGDNRKDMYVKYQTIQ